MGFCPFHDDKHHRSLNIYQDAKGRTRWRCFVCGTGSTEIDAVMHSSEKMTRDAANRWLTTHGYMQETEQDARDRYRNGVYYDFYKWTNELLRTDKRAAGVRAYLASRNIRAGTILSAPIGFYPSVNDVDLWLSEHEVAPSIAEEFIADSKMKFAAENSLAFFYRSSYDQFTRIKLRNVINERKELGKTKTAEDIKKEKSIINLGNKKSGKMGFFTPTMEAADTDHAIVVEGEFDALAVLSMCRDAVPDCIESIYCFGGGGSMEEGMNIFPNLGIDDVYIFPDNDEPGINYAFEVAEAHPHSFVIKPEDYRPGEDPADWAGRSDFDALQETFRQRIPAFSWLGIRLAQDAGNGTVEEQSHLKEKVLALARRLSPTNRELFLKSYAPITGVSFESLLEESQNNEQLRYRKVLNSEGFGLQMAVPGKKGEVTWEPIANAFMENDSDIILDDGFDESRNMMVRIIMANKEITLTVTSKDYSSDTALYATLLDKVGSDLWIKPRCLGFFREAATLLPRTYRQRMDRKVYTYTGWVGDRFLMPNGYIDAEGWHDHEGESVELPPSPTLFTRYRLDPPPADMSYIRHIILDDILQVFPYRVTLPMIAHTFLPPLMRYFTAEHPYCLWVQGLTGSFKTTYTALMNCFWGNFKSGDFETFRSTANALERNGHILKDCPYVVDDYKKIDISDKTLTTLIQNYANGNGRSRLNPDATSKRTWAIRGILTATGEDFPSIGETSVLARTLPIVLTTTGDTAKLTKGQLHSKYLPGVMAKFIQFVLNKKLKEEDVFNTLSIKKQQFTGGHKRSAEVLALNSFAWDLFAEFLDCQYLSTEYYNGLATTQRCLAEATKGEQAGVIFIDLLRELISAGTHYLAGTQLANDTIHREGATQLGWVTPDCVYLLGSVALAEANGLRQRTTGSKINYSQQAIHDQLVADGIMIPTSAGKLTHVRKFNGQSARVLKIARGVLTDDETLSIDAEHTDSEVWATESGVIVN